MLKHLVFTASLLMLTASTQARGATLADLNTQTHYHGIAVNRVGTAKLLLATHHGLFALDETGAATLVSPVQDFMGFSPHPTEALSYFASGHPATGGNLGFIASKDGGANWEQVSPGLDGPVDFHQLDVSPADSLVVYGVYGNVQRSADGGQSWTKTGDTPPGLIAIAASSIVLTLSVGAAMSRSYGACEVHARSITAHQRAQHQQHRGRDHAERDPHVTCLLLIRIGGQRHLG